MQNNSRKCLTGNGENGKIIPDKCKKVLAIVIYLLYIKVLIEMIKRWFGEFFKNLVTMMKRHRTERG